MCHTLLCNLQFLRVFGVTDGLLFGGSSVSVQVPSFCVAHDHHPRKTYELFQLELIPKCSSIFSPLPEWGWIFMDVMQLHSLLQSVPFECFKFTERVAD